jgi:ATP-dependent RNA helicase RhlE
VTFSGFNFSPRVAAGITALGYQEPTPIQQQAIPPIMAGRDVMGLAQTGTGKTAAFALPILQRLEAGPRGRVRALVIAPTRELAEQIHQSFVDLGRQTRLRSVTVYGGVGLMPQIQALRAGPEIVVACPGRLLDHIRQGTVNLAGVEVLVLDEADRMFDMGFLPDVRRIVRAVPQQRQTLLFSATMPDDIRSLASEVLADPLTVQIGHAAPVETVSHALYPVAQHLKTALLTDLLRGTGEGSVLIFTRTKHRAKRVAQQLQRAGFDATSLQGNLSQNQRQAALDGFRAGDFRIMVATDIAARGIDVLRISHVINYDMPDTVDAYTHRIGRTGRAEQTGTAFTLVTQDDVNEVRAVEQVLGYKLERRMLDGFDYRAPAPMQDREFARDPRPQSTRQSPRSFQQGQPQLGPRQAPEPFTVRRPVSAGQSLPVPGPRGVATGSPAPAGRPAAPRPSPAAESRGAGGRETNESTGWRGTPSNGGSRPRP